MPSYLTAVKLLHKVRSAALWRSDWSVNRKRIPSGRTVVSKWTTDVFLFQNNHWSVIFEIFSCRLHKIKGKDTVRMYGQLMCILKSGQIILLVLKGQISCFWFHYWEYAQPEKGKCLFGPQLPYKLKQLALCVFSMCFLSSLKHQARKHEFY